jgi:hypothetical protein
MNILEKSILTEQDTNSNPEDLSEFDRMLYKNKKIIFRIKLTNDIRNIFSFSKLLQDGFFEFILNRRYIYFVKLMDSRHREIKLDKNKINLSLFNNVNGGRIVHIKIDKYNIYSPNDKKFELILMNKTLNLDFTNNVYNKNIFYPKVTII